MDTSPIRILLVEDNRGDAVLLQDMLMGSASGGGFDLVWDDRLGKALDRLRRETFDAILLDLTLPDSRGLATLERIREAARTIPLIVLTGVEDEEVAIRAIRQGAQDYLVKGTVDGRAIAKAIRFAIDRKKTEDALRRSEAAYATAKVAVDTVNALSVGVVLVDVKGNVLSVNPTFERMTGYRNSEMAGTRTDACLHLLVRPEDLPETLAALAAAQQGGSTDFLGVTIIAKNGSPIPLIVGVSTIRDPVGLPGTIVMTLNDVSDLKRAEQVLEAYQAELRALSFRLSLAEERARRDLAVALHDTVGQTLALSKIKLGALGQLVTTPEASRELAAIREMFEEAVRQTRTLSFELSPPILYELGLDAALEWLGEEFQKRHGFEFQFDCEDKESIPESVSVLMFQAVRELLVNVGKHAKAKQVKVTSRMDGPQLCILVKDDGKGFDVEAATSASAKKASLGLFSIRERMRHIGGSFTVDTKPGSGTAATLRAPLDKKNTVET